MMINKTCLPVEKGTAYLWVTVGSQNKRTDICNDNAIFPESYERYI